MKRWLGLVVALALAGASTAHEGPHSVAERLAAEISARGGTAGLHTRRGDELAMLGRSEESISEYRAAVALDPGRLSGLIGLSKALLRVGRAEEALAVAKQAGAAAFREPDRGASDALLAKALQETGSNERAVEAWQRAVDSERPEIDWVLSYGELLDRLGRRAEAVEAFASACERNPSLVLRRAWIDASIEAGQGAAAADWIDKNVQPTRRQPTWLVLRARARRAAGDRGAFDDLRLAITALSERIQPGSPNPILEHQYADADAMLADWLSKGSSTP